MTYYLILEYRQEPSVIEEYENKEDVIYRIVSSGASGYRIFTNEVKLTIEEQK